LHPLRFGKSRKPQFHPESPNRQLIPSLFLIRTQKYKF
jgi:hypothetical protein